MTKIYFYYLTIFLPINCLSIRAQETQVHNFASNNDVTLQSYDSRVNEYQGGTVNQVSGVFKNWIDETLHLLQPGAKILEIGSALGRDAHYIESFGFEVNCTDAAQSFVDFLSKNGHSARLFNILTDEFDATYDLIFANAVFLHFQPNELETILKKIPQGLNRGGLLSFSLKYGEGEEWTVEKLGLPRYFCYWNEERIMAMLVKQGYEVIYFDGNEKWLQIIAMLNQKVNLD